MVRGRSDLVHGGCSVRVREAAPPPGGACTAASGSWPVVGSEHRDSGQSDRDRLVPTAAHPSAPTFSGDGLRLSVRLRCVEPPDTRYPRTGGLNVAYQVVGDGPIDLVEVPGVMGNLETAWQQPAMARFHESCARFARYIMFDRRGSGLSDRLTSETGSTVEERVDDVRAVMDAAGAERAAIYGVADGGPVAVVFAATYPERTSALILNGTTARARWAPDYPSGLDDDAVAQFIAHIEAEWGSGVTASMFNVDDSQRRVLGRIERLTGTPKAAAALVRATFATTSVGYFR